ncbi:hypothetical protein ACFIJ5_03655 [Haloimpatiens sp. FM7330]|uniref:hypothetical protein n=1 Tax=Haloimpatiens sp. FM7330 TaxID=3298610 RepID=UPI00363E884D
MNEYNDNVNCGNISKKVYLVEVLTSIIVIPISLFCSKDLVYKNLSVLPIAFFIFMILFSNIFIKPKYNYGIIFYFSNAYIFARYVITPISIIMNPKVFIQGPDPNMYSINMSFILMIYELLCVFITIYIAVNTRIKLKRKEAKKKYSLFKNDIVIMIFLVITLLILSKFPNSIIPSNFFAINEKHSEIVFNTKLDGAIEILSQMFKCVGFMFGLKIIEKIMNKNRFICGLCVLLVVIVFLGLFTGTSRITIIIMACAGIKVAGTLFPKYKKKFISVLLVVLSIAIINISLYKFSWIVKDSMNPLEDLIKFMSGQFQAYFSGPRLVAQSIDMKLIFKNSISIETLINDFFGSVPYISNFINQSDRINIYFNMYNYKYTSSPLIMPLIGIGYNYFGVILSPIFTIICEYIVMRLDYIVCEKEKRLEFIFIYIYLGCRLSMCMGTNTQSLIYSFLNPVIPLYILVLINKKISLRNKLKTYMIN